MASTERGAIAVVEAARVATGTPFDSNNYAGYGVRTSLDTSRSTGAPCMNQVPWLTSARGNDHRDRGSVFLLSGLDQLGLAASSGPIPDTTAPAIGNWSPS